MRKIFDWAPDPDDDTDGARCSGCGRFVPCRHCPSDTPVLTFEQWAAQEAAWARTSHQLCLFCERDPDLCDH